MGTLLSRNALNTGYFVYLAQALWASWNLSAGQIWHSGHVLQNIAIFNDDQITMGLNMMQSHNCTNSSDFHGLFGYLQ